MSRSRLFASLLAATLFLTVAPHASAASPKPAFSVTSLATPTNFAPGGEEGVEYTYDVRAANLGAAATDESPITITDTLPKGLTVKDVTMFLRSSEGKFDYGPEACEVQEAAEVATVSCEISNALPESAEPALVQPSEERRVVIEVNPPPAEAEEGEVLTNHVVVEGGGSVPATTTSHEEVNSEPASAGISLLHTATTEVDGEPAEGAASHPYQLTVGFAVNTKPGQEGAEAKFVPAGGDIKDIEVAVPPGLIGNPTAIQRCAPLDFNTTHTVTIGSGATNGFFTANACSDASVVGLVLVQRIEGVASVSPIPLYNLEPPPGVAAEFGAQILNLPFYIDFEARPDKGYRIFARLKNLTQAKRLVAATTVIWGTPGDPLHDPVRGSCLNELPEILPITLPGCEPPEGLEENPFLRLPTSCLSPLDIGFAFDNWTVPGEFVSESTEGITPSGCNQVPFEPTFEARPTTNLADSPTGLHAKLHNPQPEEEPGDIGEADLRKTVVTLPKGMALNPSSANGLKACSEAEIGYEGKREGADAFSNEPANCPPASRVATVKVKTPLIDHTLETKNGADGSIYIATPHENPFDSLLAIYLAVHDPVSGAIVKLAAKAEPDPVTGQIITTFDETPQVPVEDFEVDFFEGPNAALRSPATCGSHTTTAVLTPWSAPESGPPLETANTFQITQPAAAQSSCPANENEEPNRVSVFQAGTVTPVSATYSPLVVHLKREDGSQEFGAVSITPPPGLLARLAGIPYCSETAIAAAQSRSGAAEKQNPSCPAASEVGLVDVGAGAGPSPYYTQGRAYLAPPYKGAPLSLAVITPAVAGPYDLGTVVVRVALHVDPETARVTAITDSIPHILEGIPLDVRSIAMKLDRPNFSLNPTNCDPLAFTGQLTSILGQTSPLFRRFQVTECKRLRFRPELSISLKGGTKRNQNPAVKAVLTYPKGLYANVSRIQVALPHSEFLDNAHFKTICTRVQFAANACPKGSIYGRARAITPLVDKPLSGPVYLRSSSHELPDLVLDLHGQIPVVAVGRIDTSKSGGIRTTFEGLPDAPLSKAVLEMQGGRKGILINSTNLCKGTHRATAKLRAQNGRYINLRPALRARCSGRSGKGG
jgi:hypothetical protein